MVSTFSFSFHWLIHFFFWFHNRHSLKADPLRMTTDVIAKSSERFAVFDRDEYFFLLENFPSSFITQFTSGFLLNSLTTLKTPFIHSFFSAYI